MSTFSVAHNYAKNQSKSSWSDDPFDLKGCFAGKASMNHEKNLDEFAQNLVQEYGKFRNDQYELTLDMLPEYEQNELARLYIETIDREIEWACYGQDQSMNSDFLCALLSMLKDDSKESRDNFAQLTRKNILTYYKKSLDDILTNACGVYSHYVLTGGGWYEQDCYEEELA